MTDTTKHPLHQAIITEATPAPDEQMRTQYEEHVAPKVFRRPDLVARDEHGCYVLASTWDNWQIWRTAWEAAIAANAKLQGDAVFVDIMVGSDHAHGRLALCGMAKTGDVTQVISNRVVELESELIHRKLVERRWTPPGRVSEINQLKAQRDALVDAMNEILRVTPLGSEAFGIAALVLGELDADATTGKGEQA